MIAIRQGPKANSDGSVDLYSPERNLGAQGSKK
jgi:hypothetical protein